MALSSSIRHTAVCTCLSILVRDAGVDFMSPSVAVRYSTLISFPYIISIIARALYNFLKLWVDSYIICEFRLKILKGLVHILNEAIT